VSARGRIGPSLAKVLIITVCWTLLLLLTYVGTYFLIDDLVAQGRLSGTYAFWPDFAGNAIIGLVGGLFGGSLLVFKLNAGYRHETFLSGIVHSVVAFLVVYLGSALVLLFSMPFVLYSSQSGMAEGLRRGLANLALNFQTPSFLATSAFFGVMVAATQFMLQVNDKFGPGVLWKLLTGKYYNPRDEERIFMFLDLRSSTAIAEQIGHKRFFELLRELFQDVTRPVIESRGEIYQYVGDEVVISWPVERGLQDANCIVCFFRIEQAIAERTAHYLERFGVSPSFKAGIHVGEATVGEIGVVKKDIVYSGDVLNTTSRIQEECNRYGVDFIASSALLGRLSADSTYEASPIGEIMLRGKAEPLLLSAVGWVGARA
jgi:adenylate cyclase